MLVGEVVGACAHHTHCTLRAQYCHTHCVAHRDLKLDNTLLDNSNPPIIKICDFGFAKTWSEEANMYTQIGCGGMRVLVWWWGGLCC